MKKIACSGFVSLLALACFSQNVGVGTNSPSEKLDVNGNLNITGNLKVNGVAGQAGQVLTTNPQGQTIWADGSSEYKNVVHISQDMQWPVPAGVTKVMIEAWGGGGGGAYGGGGSSSPLLRIINLTVVPGNNINITIGVGGAGAATMGVNASDGTNTVIFTTWNGYTYTSSRGLGGRANGPGPSPTVIGTASPNLYYIMGNSGEATTEDYHQYNSTDFVKTTRYGNGGNCAYLNTGGGKGGFQAYDMTASSGIMTNHPTGGAGHGAGGGGGYTSSATYGADGGRGYVLIWY